MSWLLKQAEDILNRVDQQTNAAIHQQTTKIPPKHPEVEFTTNTSSYIPSIPVNQPVVNHISTQRNSIVSTRRTKKDEESDLINFLNSPTPVNNNEIKKPIRVNNKSRTNSTSSTVTDDKPLILNIPSTEESKINNTDQELIISLQLEIQRLIETIHQYENELQISKRQHIQYQHQIGESDALLHDLRTRESDSLEILSTKDSQIALLRIRLNESDELLQTKIHQYEQLKIDYSRLLQDSSNSSSQSSDFLQSRIIQLEQELERNIYENERLNIENHQLIEQLKQIEKQFNDEHLQFYEQQQQIKSTKNRIQQFEQDMNEYKLKAQRILQTKDKLIIKLKDIIQQQQRSSTPTIGDQHEIETIHTNDDSILLDGSLVGNSNWTLIQYEELKNENELFKQELQARELTIHTLRHELQESDLLIQQTDQQYHEQINQLNEQLKDKQSHLILTEQDYRKLKQELTIIKEDFRKQKQMSHEQLIERERELERLRLQLTSKTMNQINDDELEKRLQILTESLIHKQIIIETLQTDKSSLTMQLERLEKRLDDYEIITTNNSLQQSFKTFPTTSISIDDNEHYENLRYRVPLLHETPYDVDLTKKVKRAANQLDQLGIRLTIFLRRYPAVRLAVLFYAIILHLWTFIVLFTYTPEIHSNNN